MIQKKEALTFAVTLGGDGEEELRLVAAIFLSAARPQHFALEASEDNIRVRLRLRLLLSTNQSWRGDGIAPTVRWAGPNS